MESRRVRLVFEDALLLSKSQRSQGLEQSWLLLRPRDRTISDLSSYILQIFALYQSCPHGLLLLMDGFVLPPFESISLLNDNDVISLRKKGSKSSDLFTIGNTANLAEEVITVDKQLLHGQLLLANEEFEKESESCHSESEQGEDRDGKKGTLSDGGSLDQNVICEKQPFEDKKCSKSSQLQKDRKVVENVTDLSEKTKGPSRNARRKKAKRKWIQGMAKIRKKRPNVNWNQIRSTGTNYHDKQSPTFSRGNGNVNLWEKLSQGLDTKKLDVPWEKCWNGSSSGWSSWSRGPARCSAS